jgi:hypothetical protein
MAVRPDRTLAASISVALAAAVLAVFARTLGHQFLNVDDTLYITSNPSVTAGLSLRGLRWAFTSTDASNWHPLTWVSHQLDVTFFGLRPWGHHLTSVLLHAANTVLLFMLLRSLTGALWRSALAATLFALHPLRVESVAWVAERKDLLAGLFWILSTVAYVSWLRRGGALRYALMTGVFAAGLMAKPMLVTLPAALLLLDGPPTRCCPMSVTWERCSGRSTWRSTILLTPRQYPGPALSWRWSRSSSSRSRPCARHAGRPGSPSGGRGIWGPWSR